VYRFLVDDANFYSFGERCLMTTDTELDNFYEDTFTAVAVADVRNGCLCRRRQFYESLLAPFVEIAKADKDFANADLVYRYTDGLNRIVRVSINNDVDAVLKQLDNCPN